MKIFTKVALIMAGTFAGIGVVCMLVAFSMGLTQDTFVQMINDGKFRIGLGEDGDLEIFGGLRGLEIKIFDDNDIIYDGDAEEESTVVIEEDYQNLDLEYGAGKLEIYYDDVEHIQIQQKNVIGFRTSADDDTLRVEGGISVNDNSNASLTIILPEGYRFDEVDLEIGASQAAIDGLTGVDLSIVVGAGQANLTNFNAKNLDIEVGAGEANVMDLQVENLDVEAGVGQVEVRISGAEEDYNYNVECGIGSVKVGKNSYGGVGAEQNITNPGAEFFMDIECGIGEVVIIFTE